MAILLIYAVTFTACGKRDKDSGIKEVDIYNVVKEVFLTDKGYTDELSKHVSKDVFEGTNIYGIYDVNSIDYTRPFDVEFSLKEDSQNKKKDIIYVKMTYSVIIRDSHNKTVGGSSEIPITFTVKKTGSDWYIVEKYEAP